MAENLPTLNYTNKDFASLKADLLSKIPQLAPEWTNLNEGDLGMALLNMVAGVGDMLAYYIDRSAEEMYLPTARARSSIKRIAALIDYRLSRPVAARTTLRFTVDTAQASNIKIPAHTVVRTKKNVYFVTKRDVTLFAGDLAVEVEAYQGELRAESFTSNGSEDQRYLLSRPNVAQNFLTVKVSGVKWTEDTRNLDYVSSGLYVVETDDSENGTLRFTRHLGTVPGQNATIEATYLETKGSEGNIGSGLATVIVSQFTGSGDLSVTNIDSATGGKGSESAESARTNAPRFLRAQNRAVTLQDYEDLLTLMEKVAKAQAVNHHGYVELFVAPKDGGDVYVELPTVALAKAANAAATLNGTYYVRVTGVDAHGETADWEYVNQVNDATDPDKDTRVVSTNEQSLAVVTGEQIDVSITEVPGATAYRVYVGTASGDVRFSGEIAAAGTGTTTYTVTDAPAADAAAPPAENTTGVRAADGVTPLKLSAEEMLELRRNIGCIFALYNPTYTAVNVTVTAKIYENFYQKEVKGRIETALREFFQFDKQDFGKDVTLSALYETLMDVEGVRSVRFTAPTDDVAMGKGEIAVAGTFSVTMEGGIQ